MSLFGGYSVYYLGIYGFGSSFTKDPDDRCCAKNCAAYISTNVVYCNAVWQFQSPRSRPLRRHGILCHHHWHRPQPSRVQRRRLLRVLCHQVGKHSCLKN